MGDERDPFRDLPPLFGLKPEISDAPSPVSWYAVASVGAANDVRVMDYATGYTGNPSVGTSATRIFPRGLLVREPQIENLSFTADIEIGFRDDLAFGAAGTGGVIRIPARYFWNRYGLFPIGQVDSSGNLKVTLASLLAGEDLTNGLLTVMPKEMLTVIHSPAAATQASASVAAGGAGVRHVAHGFVCSLITAAAASAVTFVLRDGATGAGTILLQFAINLPANADRQVTLSSLNIPGTANTAMTFETTGAPAAGASASANLIYSNKS